MKLLVYYSYGSLVGNLFYSDNTKKVSEKSINSIRDLAAKKLEEEEQVRPDSKRIIIRGS